LAKTEVETLSDVEMEEDHFLFGNLVVRNKLATQEQVDECIEIQHRLEEKGSLEKLGNIMTSKGYLSDNQLRLILKAQQRISRNSGQRIPGYEIVSKLGQGSMGSVYRAKQISMDRAVAIKVLSQQYSRNKQYVNRFLQEARAAAQLSHSNIVRAIDVGNVRDLYYFVMEFVDGASLQDRLRKDEIFEEKEALDIIIQICAALKHSHSHEIIHRDVKPDNILVDKNGQAKLCDLGLARAAAESTGITDHGTPLGTPYYMSCEQARGEKDLDARTDIYSLGATLYHLVTGKVPFEGDSGPVVMVKHLTEELIPASDRKPGLDPKICAVISRMMNKEPDNRHDNAEQVEEDLRAIREHRSPPHTESILDTISIKDTKNKSTRVKHRQTTNLLDTKQKKGKKGEPKSTRKVRNKKSVRPVLTFLTGQEKGNSFPVSSGMTVVGRLPDCDIQVKDIWFSRKHFIIHEDKDRFEIEDLGSMNGTRINGRAVQRAELQLGDQIAIYDTLIRFDADEE
jgi:serine/threonine protein kinase